MRRLCSQPSRCGSPCCRCRAEVVGEQQFMGTYLGRQHQSAAPGRHLPGLAQRHPWQSRCRPWLGSRSVFSDTRDGSGVGRQYGAIDRSALVARRDEWCAPKTRGDAQWGRQ